MYRLLVQALIWLCLLMSFSAEALPEGWSEGRPAAGTSATLQAEEPFA